MNKQEFLAQLHKELAWLPKEDIDERLRFYGEIIDDRIEEGISEEEAVSEIGSVSEIVKQIIADLPLTKIAKQRIKPKRNLKVLEIVLLALGSPIWLSLCIVTLAVIFSIYVSLWSIIISFWAVFNCFVACSFGCFFAGILIACSGGVPVGLFMIAAALICAALSIFSFYGCKAATKGIIKLTKKISVWIKSIFIRKEELQ